MNNVNNVNNITYYHENKMYNIHQQHYKVVNNEIILSGQFGTSLDTVQTPIEIVFNGHQKGLAYYSTQGSLRITMSDKKIIEIPAVKEEFLIDFHKYCCSKLYKCLRFNESEKVKKYIEKINNIKNTALMTKRGVPMDLLPNIYKYLK